MTSPISNKASDWFNLGLGAALFGSAFLFGSTPSAAWTAAIIGAVVVSCTTAALFQDDRDIEWFNLGLGLVAALAPFLVGFAENGLAVSIHLLFGLGIASTAAVQVRRVRTYTVVPARVPAKSPRRSS